LSFSSLGRSVSTSTTIGTIAHLSIVEVDRSSAKGIDAGHGHSGTLVFGGTVPLNTERVNGRELIN
jgi:hypothetical protein